MRELSLAVEASCKVPRVALGSDAPGALPAALERRLRELGYDVLRLGVLREPHDDAWPHVGRAVAQAVVAGDARFGVVCCWTGTGVAIAANKVRGARAALCADAATAAGARTWNDANVLCLSLRATSEALGCEILDAWCATSPTEDPKYAAMIAEVRAERTFEAPP